MLSSIYHQSKQEKIKKNRELKKEKRLNGKGKAMFLKCKTIKPEKECVFMTTDGCFFDGGSCDPIVEQCIGCANIEEWSAGKYCNCYANPKHKWSAYDCNRATHILQEDKKAVFVDPLKASKKAMKQKAKSKAQSKK